LGSSEGKPLPGKLNRLTKDRPVTTIWIDGKYCDRDTAMVSVFDHGLLYGDGVSEDPDLRRKSSLRRAALDRLYASAKAIWLSIPDPPA
jgi:branched-chain amino acid aminotransferase